MNEEKRTNPINVAKASKEELRKYLTECYDLIKDNKELADRYIYLAKAEKSGKKIMNKDYRDLAKDIESFLTAKPETDAKPADSPKESEKKADTKKSDKKTGKDSKKDKEEKPAESKNEVQTETATNSKTIPLAKMFSEKIKTEDSEFEIAHDIKTMEDLLNATNNQEVLVFAFYWTKRHLKQFPYFENMFESLPEKFVDDLDLCQLVWVAEEKHVAYAVSVYTDAMYTLLPKDLEEFEGLRLSRGMEYQIYRQI